MKRSEFFKSLAGIAVGAVVAPVIILDALAPGDLPIYPRGEIIQTEWDVSFNEAFEMKPNSDPLMTQEEYNKQMEILQAKLMERIDRGMKRNLI